MDDLISVIVPVYNVENYLEKCVDSILNQTYKNLEIILVDDGSTDNCGKMCDEYAKKDGRIKVIHKQNGGLSDARNAGIDIAQGEFIGFIDSDDYIHLQMYEILYNAIIEANADVAKCDFKDVYANDDNVFDNVDIIKSKVYTNQELITGYFFKDYIWEFAISACVKLYRKEIFNNLRFPKGRLYEDYYIKYDILTRANKVVIVDQVLYYYFHRDGSIMHSNVTMKSINDMHTICKNDLEFFISRNDKMNILYQQDEYLTRFTKDKLAVYIKNREMIKDFKPANNDFKKIFLDCLINQKICKLKKIMMIFLFINTRVAYKLCLKYFPECLHPFMREDK